jgi:hypothetical protein
MFYIDHFFFESMRRELTQYLSAFLMGAAVGIVMLILVDHHSNNALANFVYSLFHVSQ